MSDTIRAVNSMLKTLEDRAQAFTQAEGITPLLTIVNGHATASSLDIARHFDKLHKNVLRDIKDLVDQLPPERELNFEPTLFEVPGPNGAVRQEPAYRITRDGFTLLAMGFTGERALAFKLAYIDAFNAMEKELQAGTMSSAMIGRVTGVPTKQLCSLQDQWWKLVQRLERTTQAEIRAGLYLQLLEVCVDMDHIAPPLESLGHEEPAQPEAATEFWSAYQALVTAGVKVNHSHKPGLIAINLRQFSQLAVAHGLPIAQGSDLKDALHQSRKPAFVGSRTVRSAIVGSPVHCWLFQAEQAVEASAWAGASAKGGMVDRSG